MCVKSLMLNVALIYVVALTQSYDLSDENCNNNNGVNGYGGGGGGGGGGGVNESDDKDVVAMMIQFNVCIKGFLNNKISPLQANIQTIIKSKIQGDQKVSVHLMTAIQSSGAHRHFDHPAYEKCK